MRLEVDQTPSGRRVLLSLEPDEAIVVAEQLRQGLSHQQLDQTHSHSILLHGSKESRGDVIHVIINAPLKG